MGIDRVAVLCPYPATDMELSAIEALRDAGIERISLHHDPASIETASVERILLVGPMCSYVRLVRGLPPDIPLRVWNTEQVPSYPYPYRILRRLAITRFKFEELTSITRLPMGRFRMVGEMLYLAHHSKDVRLSTYSVTNAQFFRALGIDAQTVPPGYCPTLGEDLGRGHDDRDIDVLFLGSTKGSRRAKDIAHLQTQFAKHQLKFEVYDGGHLGKPAIFGKHRTDVLNRCKVFLSIGRREADDHIFRMFLAGSNRAAVVTAQTIPDATWPFERDVHFEMAHIDGLVSLVQILAGDAERLQQMRDSLHFKVHSMPMHHQVLTVIQ
jgi:hypothetical protein